MNEPSAGISKTKLESVHTAVTLRLEAAGQRYTPGRRQLVEALALSPRPLEMPAILDASPDLPQSSAYRALQQLAMLGIVRRINTSADSAHFELTEQIAGEHHHHAICESCNRVVDIDSTAELEKALHRAAQITGAQTGFTIQSHRIDLVGVCPDCASDDT